MRAPSAGPSLAIALALCAGLGVASTGCGGRAARAMQWLGLSPTYASGLTEDELRKQLLAEAQRFAIGTTAAADAIAAASSDREVRRRALLWKINIVPLAGSVIDDPDPQAAYVALLTLATSQRKYLTEGEGATLFGDQQEIAVGEGQRREQEVLALGLRFLTPSAREAMRWQVEDLTWRYPMRNVFLVESSVRGFAQAERGGAFNWVVGVPMAPFRALEGVDSGAQAIHEFNVTARGFSDQVGRLPEVIRWQAELLMYDAESRDTTVGGLAAFQSVADSAARLATAAERLPADVRAQIDATLAGVDQRQASLQKTLADARGGVADLDAALAKASELSTSLQQLATQADRVGATWQQVATTLRGPESPGATEGRPFDITEYERAAARIESASNAVREMAGEIRASGDAFRGLLDAFFVRLGLLLVAFFALRWGFARLGRRGSGTPS